MLRDLHVNLSDEKLDLPSSTLEVVGQSHSCSVGDLRALDISEREEIVLVLDHRLRNSGRVVVGGI